MLNEELTAAMDQATRRDKWFFEHHRHRRYRLRATFSGEFPLPDLSGPGGCTIVAKVAPAWRMRFYAQIPVALQLDTDAHCEWLLNEAGFDLAMIESARAQARQPHA